jgi:hypothetical protein
MKKQNKNIVVTKEAKKTLFFSFLVLDFVLFFMPLFRTNTKIIVFSCIMWYLILSIGSILWLYSNKFWIPVGFVGMFPVTGYLLTLTVYETQISTIESYLMFNIVFWGVFILLCAIGVNIAKGRFNENKKGSASGNHKNKGKRKRKRKNKLTALTGTGVLGVATIPILKRFMGETTIVLLGTLIWVILGAVIFSALYHDHLRNIEL